MQTFGDIKNKLKLAFKLYDIDDNGSIEKKEMIKVVDSIYRLMDTNDDSRKVMASGVVVESIIQSLDVNGDSRISAEEFIEGCLKDENIRNILVPFF